MTLPFSVALPASIEDGLNSRLDVNTEKIAVFAAIEDSATFLALPGLILPWLAFLAGTRLPLGRFSPAGGISLATLAAFASTAGLWAALGFRVAPELFLMIHPHLLFLPLMAYACFISCVGNRTGRYGKALASLLILGQGWAWLWLKTISAN